MKFVWWLMLRASQETLATLLAILLLPLLPLILFVSFLCDKHEEFERKKGTLR